MANFLRAARKVGTATDENVYSKAHDVTAQNTETAFYRSLQSKKQTHFEHQLQKSTEFQKQYAPHRSSAMA